MRRKIGLAICFTRNICGAVLMLHRTRRLAAAMQGPRPYSQLPLVLWNDESVNGVHPNRAFLLVRTTSARDTKFDRG